MTNTFSDLHLHPQLLSALQTIGYETPTDIQAQAIPFALDGDDILASAQTGTGKTAAFGLPILHLLEASREKSTDSSEMNEAPSKGRKRSRKNGVKALILSPTRELSQQIEDNLVQYSQNLSYKIVSVVGGLSIKKQINDLKDGADIVVATPGRLLDLMNRKAVWLGEVEFFVLDEADRMLDMGFVHDVR
ncbi:MAG: DEAD/DEAH box helicase, partial [Bdellovibrionales bacterium]|nr:DEAD/DEAH box helicase [Bdellovibrionales bacterium]